MHTTPTASKGNGRFAIDGQRPHRTLGVHFKPGGAYALLPLGQHELENAHVPLADVIGAAAQRLVAQLEGVHGDEAVLKTMARFLTGLLHRQLHPAIAATITRIESDGPGLDVKTLVDASSKCSL